MNVTGHLSAKAWILSKSCGIRKRAASLSKESWMVLNVIQSSVSISTSGLMIERRLLIKQLMIVGPGARPWGDDWFLTTTFISCVHYTVHVKSKIFICFENTLHCWMALRLLNILCSVACQCSLMPPVICLPMLVTIWTTRSGCATRKQHNI